MPLSVMAFVLAAVFTVVVLPIVAVLHYVTKWKTANALTAEEQRMLEELWTTTESMDSRLNALEAILNDASPDWRKRI